MPCLIIVSPARAILELVDGKFWPGEENAVHRADFRRELDSYLAMEGIFRRSKAISFWTDAEFDVLKPEHKRMTRPIQLWMLWRKQEVQQAPHLVRVMKVLTSIWPSQSASERANGVMKRASASTEIRNRMSQPTRFNHTLLCDRYNSEEQRPDRITKFKKRRILAATGMNAEDDDEEENQSDTDSECGLPPGFHVEDEVPAPDEPVDVDVWSNSSGSSSSGSRDDSDSDTGDA